MNNAQRLQTCFVCGRRLSMIEGVSLANARALRHENCSKQKLVRELRAQADGLGLTSLDLLTRRLAELQEGLIEALGEVSFEQFQTAQPAGYLHLFLCGSDLKVRVVFSRHVQSEAIYLETLMTPSEVRQQKARMLVQIREQTPARAGSIHMGPIERLLSDWLIVADWLRQSENHWNGRKKEEIAREILGQQRVQCKILTSTGMDVDLSSRPFAPNCSKLERIARQMLALQNAQSGPQLAITRGELEEVA